MQDRWSLREDDADNRGISILSKKKNPFSLKN